MNCYKVKTFSDRTEWYNDGKLHRIEGPAIEWNNGNKFWYKHGKLHRMDGPACEYINGIREWWKNGKRHREDGPAIIYSAGTKFYFIEGNLITENDFLNREKPIEEHDVKVFYVCNMKNEGFLLTEWFVDGKAHRESGPAKEYSDGSKEYALNGRFMNEEEWKAQKKL